MEQNVNKALPAVVTGDARTEIKTKSNGSTYVSLIVEITVENKQYKVWANRTLTNAKGEAKSDVAEGDKVMVYHHTFLGKDGETMHSFDISKGAEVASNDVLNDLFGTHQG